jgi:hypothetical protein
MLKGRVVKNSDGKIEKDDLKHHQYLNILP